MTIKIFCLAIALLFNGVICLAQDRHYTFTTNILAPLASARVSNPTAFTLLPLASNLEYGFTASAGYIQNKCGFDARLTIGKANSYAWTPQLQIGYQYYFNGKHLDKTRSWYVGASLRYWDYINQYTHSQRHSISPNLIAGYMFEPTRRLIIDIRLSQMIGVASVSNIDHSRAAANLQFSPMPLLSPVLPFVSFNIGYKWTPSSNVLTTPAF